MASIGELFIELGFDVDDKSLKSFNDSIKTGMGDLLKFSAVATGALYSLNKFIAQSLQGATALSNYSSVTGQSTEAIRNWYAVLAGGVNPAVNDINQVIDAFRSMNDILVDINVNGKGPSGAFNRLGINSTFGKNAEQILEELRQNLATNYASSLGVAGTNKLMKEIGVSDFMIKGLQLSGGDFRNRAANNTLTDNELKKISDFDKAIAKALYNYDLWRGRVTADIAPTLIQWLQNLTPVIGAFGDALVIALGAMKPFIQEILIGGAAVIAVLKPWVIIITALVTALADLARVSKGLPSISGIPEWLANNTIIGNGAMNETVDINNSLKPKSFITNLLKAMDDKTFELANPISMVDQYAPMQGMVNRMNFMNPEGTKTQNDLDIHNTYNINSTAPAEDLAAMVAKQQQLRFLNAYDSLNNGTRY
jgi:hypothetical protein